MSGVRPTYWLTRFMILRLLGVIYAVAFLAAINQLIPLIGQNGLLPVGLYLKQAGEAFGSTQAGFMRLPSVFWFGHSDTALLTVAWIGFLLSCIVVIGYANAPMLAVLWFLYMSIVHVGQDWYGYGWEIQLLETGFLGIFLCPLIDPRPFPGQPPPIVVIILLRWLIFRIMLGSVLIKLRGDEVWTNGTALYYHFETQPLPGPLSRWFHFLPRIILKWGVWFTFLAEGVAPLFVFWPRIGRHIAGTVIVLLQIILIVSGNLSFLNWLTILPALSCFDDGYWLKILPRWLVRQASSAHQKAADACLQADQSEPSKPAQITSWVIAAIIGLLSIPPVINMLSPRQIMNTSFDPLDLVNTYGAFGSVGRERLNVVFEGTMDGTPDDKANWIAYPYKGLPVATDKMPPQVAPYQLRLDWQMWFASMSTPGEYPWTFNLVYKLLHNDPGTLSLFAANPFAGKPPRFIRALLYRYAFEKAGRGDGQWWTRERVGDVWIPALSVDDPRLTELLKSAGWIP